MKTFRKLVTNAPFMALFTGLFFLLSFEKQSSVLEVSSLNKKDVFTSIMFLDGSLVQKIAPLKDAKESLHQGIKIDESKSRAFENEFIIYIQKKNPNFLNDFYMDMRSHNPIIIEERIKNTQNEILKFTDLKLKPYNLSVEKLSQNYNGKTFDLQNYSDNKATVQEGACLYEVLAVVTVVVAIAFVYAAAAFFKYGPTQDQMTYSDQYLSATIAEIM